METDLPVGMALVGTKAAALRHAAKIADTRDRLVVADSAVSAPEVLVELTQRYRASGISLVVIAESITDVPDGALANLTVVEVESAADHQ